MTRSELIRRMVLSAICDDYENVDQAILGMVAEAGAKRGLTVERSEIVDALAALIDDGLAKAYDWCGPNYPLQGMPPLDIVEENFKTHFYRTEKGLDLQRSDPVWLGND
jgi:hypothetical protein